LKVALHQFKDEFMKQNGRPVSSPADKEPVKDTYARYKILKNKMKSEHSGRKRRDS